MKKNLHTISLLGLVADHKRPIKSGREYDKYFPVPKNNDTILNNDGTVKDTVDYMEDIVHKTLADTAKIAPLLKGETLADTCQNIWNFIFNHIQYKLDDEGIEQLRRPSRLWYDRTTGGDCDCMAIFASSILTNLGIDHKFRITKYDANWQHVYVVVPLPEDKSRYYVIDCVLNLFNDEKPYSDKIDHSMKITSLNGIPIAMLGNIEDTSYAAIHAAKDMQDVMEGTAFNNMDEYINGLGADTDENSQTLLDSIYQHIVSTREAILKNPQSVSRAGGADAHIKMLDYAIAEWDKSPQERDAALDALEKAEDSWNDENERIENEIQNKYGISGINDDLDGIVESYDLSAIANENDALSGIGNIEPLLTGLGILSGGGKKKSFWSNIKKAVKAVDKFNRAIVAKVKEGAEGAAEKIKTAAIKVGGIIKNILIKTNPLLILARAGVYVAMRVNIFDFAERFYPGYFTQEQAAKAHVSAEAWLKAKENIAELEKIITKIGGKPANIKKAILNGRANRKFKGLSGSIGIVGVDDAAIVGSVTAAAGVLAKVSDATKNISKTAETVNKVGNQASGVQGFIAKIKDWFSKKKDQGENFKDIDPKADEATAAQEEPANAATTSPNQTTAADTTSTNNSANTVPADSGSGNGLVNWAKANPGKTAAITLSSAALVSLAFPKVRQAIGIGKKTRVAINGLSGVKKHARSPKNTAPKKHIKSVKKQTVKSIKLK